MNDQSTWSVDRTINLPSLFSVLAVAFSGMWWLANLQFQTNANTATIAEWRVTWAQFTQKRDDSVRSYEQRMTAQETLGSQVIKRLDDIRDEQKRVSEILLTRVVPRIGPN